MSTMYIREVSMFQIEKKEYVNKTFRIPKELADHLAVVAQEESISMNELVIQCCTYALNDSVHKFRSKKKP